MFAKLYYFLSKNNCSCYSPGEMKPWYSIILSKVLNFTNSKILNGVASELGMPEMQEGR